MRYVTVDPGLSGTGWAAWTEHWELIGHGVIRPPRKCPNRNVCLSKLLYKFVKKYGPNKFWIEYPKKFDSAKGDMVAARGDLVKLAALVGHFEAYLVSKKMKVEMLDVNIWKGQMPKEAVMHRIKRILPGIKPVSHDWDAIGMGLHLRGDF